MLALAVVLARGANPPLRLAIDAALVLVTLATLAGWNAFGRPNPSGLGALAVAIELAPLVAAGPHAVRIARGRGSGGTSPSRPG